MNTAFLAGGMPGPFEILLILFVILLLFGAKRLPELARSLGKSLSEFKKGKEEGAKAAELEPHNENEADHKKEETTDDR